MNKLRLLLNKETISYLFFGVLTTIVDTISFYIINIMLGKDFYVATTVISWILAVLFAFVTNKLWVFNSHSFAPAVVMKELIAFVAARLLTLGMTIVWMIVTVEFFHFDEFIAKLLSAIFVVILNYVFSKLFIFKNKK